MKKILLLVPRITDFEQRETKFVSYSERLRFYTKLVNEGYEVDLLYFQSLFVEERLLNYFKNIGINTINFREFRKDFKSLEKVYQKIFDKKYDYIIYLSSYLVRQTIYYINQYAKDSILCLDSFDLQFLAKLKNLSKVEKNFFEKSNLEKVLDIQLVPIVGILRYLDLVIVSEETEKDFLGKEIIDLTIEILKEQEIRKNNLSVLKNILNNSKKKYGQENFYKDLDILLVSGDKISSDYENFVKENMLNNFEIKIIDAKNYTNSIVKNVNIGIQTSKKRYCLILVDGCITSSFSLGKMFDVIKNKTDVATVIPVSNEEIKIDNRSSMSFDEILNFLVSFELKHYQNNITLWQRIYFTLINNCVLLDKEYIEKVGYLDENYNMLSYALQDLFFRFFQINKFVIKTNESFVYCFNTKNILSNETNLKEKYNKNYLVTKWGLNLSNIISKIVKKQ